MFLNIFDTKLDIKIFFMKTQNKKPTAYLIVGFIGSGKTTFAKKLEKKAGALRFTKDEWFIRIFGNDPTIDGFEKYDERITNLCIDIALECLRAGNDVIIDDGFWFRSQRDDTRKRIKKLGANAQLYYVKCSDKKMKQRTSKRSENPTKDAFRIDEVMFDSYKKYFDELGNDEEHIVIESK